MNAVTQAVIERPVDSSQIGEIIAAWQITPEALMIIGWRQEKPPADGTVAHQQPGSPRGRFQSVAWPFATAGAEAHQFVAALQLPPGAVVRPAETLLLTARGDSSGVLARLPPRFLPAETFGTELAVLAARHANLVISFLTQTFPAALTRANADVRSLLHAFLERASAPDGCIEIAGSVDDHCVILQGWGAAPGPQCDMIAIGSAIERLVPKIATFARPDMRGTACGQVVVLPATAAADLAQLEAIVLLDRRGPRWRPMLPERRLLSGKETTGHLRTMLPALQCEAATQALLKASLRPRFDGKFTLYDAGHPIRFAVDLAASAAGAGAYLTGWLYDPSAAVVEVHLRTTRGGSVRLDTKWTRILREDVTDAFRNESSLPKAELGKNMHGFAVHAGAVLEGETFYLDVSFRDGQCGFVPLTMEPAGDLATRARLLAGVDLHKSSGVPIIEHHLAPFFVRLPGIGSQPTIVSPVPVAWSTSIVGPLADPILPRALLSHFLRDPLGPDEGLVFVYGENWTPAAAEALGRLAAFYGVAAARLRVHGAASIPSALTAVVACSDTRRLLLLAPGTVGRSPGWRAMLHAALDASDGTSCVSPTVIYEDESIRFAGPAVIEALEAAPYIRVKRQLAGMPVSIIGAADVQETGTASPACCLMPREVVTSAAALEVLATGSAQEAAMTLLLRRKGVKCLWAPAAQVYAADAPSPDTHENTARVGQMVDGWCLRTVLASEI